MGVCGVVIYVPPAARAVGGVPSWAACVSRHVGVCVCRAPSCYSECGVL